jgi:hypothetical protein
MAKKLRKSQFCSNCDRTLSDDNFCPECGQQNTTNNVDMGMLVKDFVDDFFTLDSRLFKTIIPLLFKPGFLTLEYNKGRRVKYLPPLRMYLVLSILMFLIPSNSIDDSSGSSSEDRDIYLAIADEDYVVNSEEFQTNEVYKDSVLNSLWLLSEDDPLFSFLGEKAVKNWLTNAFTLANNGNAQDVLFDEMASKFTNMMFVMLPFFALLLLLFFRKQNILYVETLVFSLHIHSFYFFSICVAKLILLFVSSGLVLVFLYLLLPFVYLVLALNKVYEQSYKRIVVKSVVVLSIYGILLLIGASVLFVLLLF